MNPNTEHNFFLSISKSNNNIPINSQVQQKKKKNYKKREKGLKTLF